MLSSNTAIIPGSVGALAKQQGVSLAESFINADVVVICDVSGSMGAHDSRGGRSRYDTACAELAQLQNANAGKIAILAFSNQTIFSPYGQPPFLGGGTDLAGALRFAKVADTGDVRFVVISDGEPDSEKDALATAAQYQGRLDVVFVGPEDRPAGREFLERLARARGGVCVTADRVTELAAQTQRLLLAG